MDINTKPCCCTATVADMALTGSVFWDFTIALVGGASYSNRLFLFTLVSPVVTVLKLFHFSYFPLPSVHHILKHHSGPHDGPHSWWASACLLLTCALWLWLWVGLWASTACLSLLFLLCWVQRTIFLWVVSYNSGYSFHFLSPHYLLCLTVKRVFHRAAPEASQDSVPSYPLPTFTYGRPWLY